MSLLNSLFNKVFTDEHFEKNFLPSDDGISVDICFTLNMTGVETFQQLQLNVTETVFVNIHQCKKGS